MLTKGCSPATQTKEWTPNTKVANAHLKRQGKIKTQKISTMWSQIMFEIKITWWKRGSPKHNLIQLLFLSSLFLIVILKVVSFSKLNLRKCHWRNVPLRADLGILSNIKCQFLKMPHFYISELLPFISIRKCQFLSLNGWIKSLNSP